MSDKQILSGRTFKLGDATALATVGVISFTVLSYVHALGYFHALGMQFMTGFSVTDFLIEGGTRIGAFALAAIAGAAIFSQSLAQDLNEDVALRLIKIRTPLLLAIIAILIYIYNVVELGFEMPFKESGIVSGGIITIILPFIIAAIFCIFPAPNPTPIQRFAVPILIAVGVMLNAVAAGDYYGAQNLKGVGDDGPLPCAFIDQFKQCHRLVFLGSDSAILLGRENIILIDRKRIRSIQTPLRKK